MQLLEEHSECDFAVLDVTLGRETAEPIAARLSQSGTPFVLLSGLRRTQLPDALKGMPLLSKPISWSALVTAVRDYLSCKSPLEPLCSATFPRTKDDVTRTL
jgi:hypothetical protein